MEFCGYSKILLIDFSKIWFFSMGFPTDINGILSAMKMVSSILSGTSSSFVFIFGYCFEKAGFDNYTYDSKLVSTGFWMFQNIMLQDDRFNRFTSI